MNPRQLARVGLGLLGVWSLLTAVGTFLSLAAIAGASAGRVAIAEIIPVTLLLGVGYLLFFHNSEVAAAMLPDFEPAAASAVPDLARTLVALTGVMLAVLSTGPAINNILAFVVAGTENPLLRGQLVRRLLASLVPIGAGLYLVARPERLLDFLDRPRPEQAAIE